MKNLLASTAIALALAAGSAFAADLPARKEAPVYVPPPPPPPLWTGFYAGLNIGGGWSASPQQTVDVTLLARFYERFGDHGVSIARRIVYLVTGDLTAGEPLQIHN